MDKKIREQKRQELIAFMQEKGFVWGPSPEIYGGMAGFYTYAPLGKSLKNKVEKVIREVFIKSDFWEVECPTVMQKEVWEASGHLGGFSDPVIITKSGSSFRADNLLEENFPGIDIPKTDDELLKLILEKGIKAPNGDEFIPEIKRHNLMMRTTIGLDTEAYNRPETATTTYLPFTRYVDFFRKKLPFGVFQIGKAYRNEISPRQYMLRMREFTQAEAQLFIFKSEKEQFEIFDSVSSDVLPCWSAQSQENNSKEIEKISLSSCLEKGYLKNKAYAYSLNLAYKLFLNMGIPSDRIRLRQHMDDEKAFYADDAWDIEIDMNTFGWTEVCGVHDRTDYDLKQHSNASGKELNALTPENTKEIPHIIEIAFGVDRPLFALLDIFYEKKEKSDGKNIFKIPYHIAPVDFAVFPLVKKGGLSEKARDVYDMLSRDFRGIYDVAGSIGRRYQRVAEQGVPFSITIDFDSLDNDDCTVRDRDSEEQRRVKISELRDVLRDLLSGNKSIDDLKL